MQLNKEYGSRFVFGLVFTLLGWAIYAVFYPAIVYIPAMVLTAFGLYLLFTCAR